MAPGIWLIGQYQRSGRLLLREQLPRPTMTFRRHDEQLGRSLAPLPCLPALADAAFAANACGRWLAAHQLLRRYVDVQFLGRLRELSSGALNAA